MKRLTTIAACLVLSSIAAAGCGEDSDGGSAQVPTATTTQQEAVEAVVDVSIGDNNFDPKAVTIQRGQSIKWKNAGAVAHTVTSDEDSTVSFDSGELSPKAAYALKPSTAGELSYYCTIHGKSQSGTVTVTR